MRAQKRTHFPAYLCSCTTTLFTKMMAVITNMTIFTTNLHMGLADIGHRRLEDYRINRIWEASRTITGQIWFNIILPVLLTQYFGTDIFNHRQLL